MEEVESTTKNVKNGFINHVFNFDNDTKCEVLNVGQYLLLAIIPMGFYNYMVDSVIPDVESLSRVTVFISSFRSSTLSATFIIILELFLMESRLSETV